MYYRSVWRPQSEMIGKQISVITCDGRNIVGTLRGYDQVTNVILEDHGGIYSLERRGAAARRAVHRRGDNIAIIGEIDPGETRKRCAWRCTPPC